MRLFFVSAAFAALCLLPLWAEWTGDDLPLRGLLFIPYTGLDYTRIFFHELGHCVTLWLFGYPSVPTFDFQHGGGMVYPVMGRVWLVQGIVFAGMVAGVYCLCRRDGVLFDGERRPLLVAALLLSLATLALAFTEWHNAAVDFMGYGAEIGIAVFCIGRAALGMTRYGVVERYLNMVFGLFVLGINVLLLLGLRTSDVVREAYAMQKGGEMQGDFEKIAERLGVGVQSVAGGSLAYMALMVALGFVILRWWRKQHEENVPL